MKFGQQIFLAGAGAKPITVEASNQIRHQKQAIYRSYALVYVPFFTCAYRIKPNAPTPKFIGTLCGFWRFNQNAISHWHTAISKSEWQLYSSLRHLILTAALVTSGSHLPLAALSSKVGYGPFALISDSYFGVVLLHLTVVDRVRINRLPQTSAIHPA